MATTVSVGLTHAQLREARSRELATPEGVPLRLNLATHGERAAAVIIDLTIVFAIIFAATTAIALFAGGFSWSGWGRALVLLISFTVRSFYFIFFELRWRGTTPGKRLLGLRVVDRRGGHLQPDAIFARNLMREVELFMPLSILLSAGDIGSDAWVTLLTLAWTSIFTLMPFFNRDRMRVGDIVAGTWVISAPKGALLLDMARAGTANPMTRDQAAAGYHFSKEQLEVYGVYELQVLENVLRATQLDNKQTRDQVCKRIQRKISWDTNDRVDARRFLEDFYAALREHLETKMLFGVRRKDKFDRR